MQDSEKTQSQKLFRRLSGLSNTLNTLPSSSHQNLNQKQGTLRSIKIINHPTMKYPAYTSSSVKQATFSPQQNLFQMSSKDVDKLYQLMGQQNKSQQKYEIIDEIFCRYHVSFFENIRNFLPNQDYHQLIDKCQLMCYSENKVICRKGNQDQQLFILLDGTVSFNEQKVMKNILLGEDQIQYTTMFNPQKGSLLNAQTLNAPKHNTYTALTRSTVTVIALNATETYLKLLKKFFVKQSDQRSYALSNTSLFKGISSLNIKRLLPYFFNKNFHKYNQSIYRQDEKADFVYWILEGEVELIKEEIPDGDVSTTSYANRQVCKIVKLSKYEIFGIDEYVFKNGCKYLFTARVCSQYLKTVCISYKSLAYIQNQYPCLNQNIDFYLKRAAVMHSKIVQKNNKLMEVKQNIRIMPIKKKNKRNKKKNPESLQWWGLAQNTVGSKKYKLQLPKFVTLQQNSPQGSKTQPMFESSNYQSSKIQQFRRKFFEQDIDDMIEAQQRKKQVDQKQQSPYKIEYMPKINRLKVKMLDVKPKAIDQTEKVKKKLLSYAKNFGSFCDKLNLD